MAKNDPTPRILPDLAAAAKSAPWHTVTNGVVGRIEGDELVLRVALGPSAIATAKPSKSGALCMVAGGAPWLKLEDIAGAPEGAKMQISVGVPNPAHDKAAAKKAQALKAALAAGWTPADLAALASK